MASEGADFASIAAGGDTVSPSGDAMLVPGGAGHLILAALPPETDIAAAGGNTSLGGGDFGAALDGGGLSAAAGLVFAHGSVVAGDLIPLGALAPDVTGAPPLPAPVPVGGHSILLTLTDNTQLLFATIGPHSGG